MSAPHTPLMTSSRAPLAADDDPADARTPHRRTRAGVLLIAVLVATTAGWLLTRGADPSSTAPGSPDRQVEGASPGDRAVGRPSSARTTGTPDLTWKSFAGLELPVSAAHGPRDLGSGRARQFSQDDAGAALAAVHLLVRTFPFAGSAVFEPTIAEQVTGADASTLERLTKDAYDQVAAAAGVTGGASIPSEGGWVAGYQLDAATPGTDQQDEATARTVRVLIRQASDEGALAFTEYTVHLVWRDGDWVLIAPRWGDWRTQARAMSDTDPALYRSYDLIGRP